MRTTTTRLLAITFAFAVGAAGCSSGGEEAIAQPTALDTAEPSTEAVVEDSSRFGDSTLEVAFYESLWDSPQDIWAMAEASDHVFVGTIVGTTEAEFVVKATDEDPNGQSEEWDGIVFAVTEVIKGDLRASDKFTVVHPAVTIDGEGNATRIEDPPIDAVLPGIDQLRSGAEGTQYLIFSAKASSEDFFMFLGPESVVEISTDGTLAVADSGPLAADREGGESLTVEELAKQIEAGPPEVEIPGEEFQPGPDKGLDPVEIEENGDRAKEPVEQSPPDPDDK